MSNSPQTLLTRDSIVNLCDRECASVPSRFRNRISKYKVFRSSACTACGKCAELCSYGVHVRSGERMLRPREWLCIGTACQSNDFYCIDKCPEGALSLGLNPLFETMGDARWPADMLMSTWVMAETGDVPSNGLEFQFGRSGGGYDKLVFDFPVGAGAGIDEEEMDLSIELNRRDDTAHRVTIDIPVYGGGMSFGSVSEHTMIGRAIAARNWNTFTCTGEGGYPESLVPFAHHIITQVATGLFGVREETIQRARIIEFKYAQGAKPGLGGHLLGDKVTPAVAQMREAVTGSALFSPFPFHSVYSVEDHKKHVDWIKAISPKSLISVKVSTPTDVDMVAVGSYYADAHIVHIDGSYGGTGAAPDIAKKNIAMPVEYAIPKVHKFLLAEGVRDRVALIASGGIRNPWDVAKSVALGADGVVIGTAEMVALECIRCANCESGRGCARGIATTDPELTQLVSVEYAARRLSNLYAAWAKELRRILKRLGMRSIRELVGRTDTLMRLS
ncbi:MAG: FMN-binding glutamate synthase family protein [Candidatus Abyssobacteria bacterium SURF_17]|uniref:glutamate synthase (NADPH) n=1 Tax=Candidatus Abyssobacteria bacterium SURF_17 TaxID=2093361 RepID=A0A419EQ82_9BACT|nr:MAG: FMN-binding glutamate synthase family protein [Candidatus Abyssubacteria bacterium SURF_17]